MEPSHATGILTPEDVPYRIHHLAPDFALSKPLNTFVHWYQRRGVRDNKDTDNVQNKDKASESPTSQMLFNMKKATPVTPLAVPFSPLKAASSSASSSSSPSSSSSSSVNASPTHAQDPDVCRSQATIESIFELLENSRQKLRDRSFRVLARAIRDGDRDAASSPAEAGDDDDANYVSTKNGVFIEPIHEHPLSKWMATNRSPTNNERSGGGKKGGKRTSALARRAMFGGGVGVAPAGGSMSTESILKSLDAAFADADYAATVSSNGFVDEEAFALEMVHRKAKTRLLGDAEGMVGIDGGGSRVNNQQSAPGTDAARTMGGLGRQRAKSSTLKNSSAGSGNGGGSGPVDFVKLKEEFKSLREMKAKELLLQLERRGKENSVLERMDGNATNGNGNHTVVPRTIVSSLKKESKDFSLSLSKANTRPSSSKENDKDKDKETETEKSRSSSSSSSKNAATTVTNTTATSKVRGPSSTPSRSSSSSSSPSSSSFPTTTSAPSSYSSSSVIVEDDNTDTDQDDKEEKEGAAATTTLERGKGGGGQDQAGARASRNAPLLPLRGSKRLQQQQRQQQWQQQLQQQQQQQQQLHTWEREREQERARERKSELVQTNTAHATEEEDASSSSSSPSFTDAAEAFTRAQSDYDMAYNVMRGIVGAASVPNPTETLIEQKQTGSRHLPAHTHAHPRTYTQHLSAPAKSKSSSAAKTHEPYGALPSSSIPSSLSSAASSSASSLTSSSALLHGGFHDHLPTDHDGAYPRPSFASAALATDFTNHAHALSRNVKTKSSEAGRSRMNHGYKDAKRQQQQHQQYQQEYQKRHTERALSSSPSSLSPLLSSSSSSTSSFPPQGHSLDALVSQYYSSPSAFRPLVGALSSQEKMHLREARLRHTSNQDAYMQAGSAAYYGNSSSSTRRSTYDNDKDKGNDGGDDDEDPGTVLFASVSKILPPTPADHVEKVAEKGRRRSRTHK